MEKQIKIPQSIKSTYEGYAKLLKEFSVYVDASDDLEKVTMDFRGNTWFEANLLPIVYAYAEYGYVKQNIISGYDNQLDCKLHEILERNNFARQCFGFQYQPRQKETVVPFKVFQANDTYGFGSYIDAELVRYFPNMDKRVKRDLSIYVQELFGNAQIHGDCSSVYTCGQYYYKHHKMDFTIVNLGITIQENVENYLRDLHEDIPYNCIEWAVEPEHSTKRTNSGGIGLSLMRDFIYYNEGKYQILSGNEFWELNNKKTLNSKFSYRFPGTIVNIEIDQNDTNYYKYYEDVEEEDLF